MANPVPETDNSLHSQPTSQFCPTRPSAVLHLLPLRGDTIWSSEPSRLRRAQLEFPFLKSHQFNLAFSNASAHRFLSLLPSHTDFHSYGRNEYKAPSCLEKPKETSTSKETCKMKCHQQKGRGADL